MSVLVKFLDYPAGTPQTVSFEEIPSLAGRAFTGDWFTVDATRLELFDHAAYTDANPHPLAVDDYPDQMVEGFHLLSLLDHLMNHVLWLEGQGAFGWNYGFDRVRFVSPIRAGEPIRLTGSLASIEAKREGFLLRADCEVQVSGRERPGFVAQWWVNWLPRAPKFSASRVVQQMY